MNADLEKLQESNKTELERRGSIFNIGAPATEAVTIHNQIAVGFGDGTVRFFQSGSDPKTVKAHKGCLLYTSPSPRDATLSRMPSSA